MKPYTGCLTKSPLNECLVCYNCTAGNVLVIFILWQSVQVGLNGFIYNNTHLMALCPGLPGWASIRKTKQSGFHWSKRRWMAVASSGPYANLHLTADK